jgi:hypothetical protein
MEDGGFSLPSAAQPHVLSCLILELKKVGGRVELEVACHHASAVLKFMLHVLFKFRQAKHVSFMFTKDDCC